MTHPSNEEWTAYLYGDAEPEARRRLTDHLRTCGECGEHVETLRQTMFALSAWEIVPTVGASDRRSARWIAFAAAAMLTLTVGLSAGIGVGRWTTPPVDTARIEANVRASLEPQLRETLRAELKDEITAEWQSALVVVRKQLREGAEARQNETLARLDERMSVEQKQFAEGFASAYTILEQQRQEELIETLRQMELARIDDNLELKRTLASLATLTGGEIQKTQRWVNELALAMEQQPIR
ncbi:MAG: hypothetical protein O3A46_14930 [Candidatus Poribacteria bacterium]|nr:hypothetical protein [Candidatus Poribacteria bacterium]